MSATTFEQISGEMVSVGKTYNVKLDVTVVELWADESPIPIGRVASRVALSPMSGMAVEDGDYSLRYSFNGKDEKHEVRVIGGTLLSGVAV